MCIRDRDSPLRDAGVPRALVKDMITAVTRHHEGELDGVKPSPVYLAAVQEINDMAPFRGEALDIGAFEYPAMSAEKSESKSK